MKNTTWFVCDNTDEPSVTDGLGREVFCDNLGEANYLCDQLNKEGDRFVGSKADPFAFDAFVNKTTMDYYESHIHIEKGLHPKFKSRKLRNYGRKHKL